MGGATTTDTYGYPSTSNRLVQITRAGSVIRQLTYDAAGNLTQDSRGLTYTYGNRNRLTGATVGALSYTYSYNTREQLVARVQASPAATTHFIHDIFGNVILRTVTLRSRGTHIACSTIAELALSHVRGTPSIRRMRGFEVGHGDGIADRNRRSPCVGDRSPS